MSLILTMRSPPSLNKLWSSAPGKKRVRSPEYSQWLRDAGWEVRMQMVGIARVDCRYNMIIQVPISRRDTGNWEKAISDLLQSVGVVSNDGNVHSLTVTPVDRADCSVELIALPEMDGVRKPAKPQFVRTMASRVIRPKQDRIARWNAIQAKLLK